ncbi:MAG: AtpZ/AtpI family protein [Deltaproteobacteria bacterium]|nr:AtpZ/AtpI family protein [Deltaproteobacteria bacterium]MCB9788436.1 AtpZ/AtpI family protein [Deltaproteobacteria bacterium]
MSKMKEGMEVASVGLEMGGCVAVGWLFGSWLDARLGTAPFGMSFFVLCGFGAAIKGLLRVVKKTRAVMAAPSVDAATTSRVLGARVPGSRQR